MDDSQNSSKPIIVNDMDLILGSELNDYQHMYKTGKKGEAMAAVVEFDSLLFDENGEVENVGKVAKKELEDEGVEEENENTVTLYSVDSENENNEEVLDSDLETPSAFSPQSESDSNGNTE